MSKAKKLEALTQELNEAQSRLKSYDCNKSGHLITAPVYQLRWKTHYHQWGEEKVLEQSAPCYKCGEIKWIPVEEVGS